MSTNVATLQADWSVLGRYVLAPATLSDIRGWRIPPSQPHPRLHSEGCGQDSTIPSLPWAIEKEEASLKMKCTCTGCGGWHRPVIPAPQEAEAGNPEFQNSLGYKARLCLKMRLGSGFCEDELTHAHHSVLGSVIKHVTRSEGGGASSLGTCTSNKRRQDRSHPARSYSRTHT